MISDKSKSEDMNTLFHFLFLSVGITFVNCDTKADIQCLKDGAKALEGKTDDQLYNLTQVNLRIGEEMVLKRANNANANGLPCYKLFYDKYTKGLDDILLNGEKQRLDKAKTPAERSGAIKALAGITQAMRCDEDWRAQHFNETIKSAQCSSQNRINDLKRLSFRPKLAILQNGLFLGKYGLKTKNKVMSGIVGEGEKCADSQSTAADKCRNLKMFVKEIDRLFQLFELQVLANN